MESVGYSIARSLTATGLAGRNGYVERRGESRREEDMEMTCRLGTAETDHLTAQGNEASPPHLRRRPPTHRSALLPGPPLAY